MTVEKFQSDLGEVAVTDSHIERRRTNEEEWERIKRTFSEKKLMDEAHFSDIKRIEYENGSVYPNIRIKTSERWHRMFFHVGDEARECFKELKYRLNVYRQTFS